MNTPIPAGRDFPIITADGTLGTFRVDSTVITVTLDYDDGRLVRSYGRGDGEARWTFGEAQKIADEQRREHLLELSVRQVGPLAFCKDVSGPAWRWPKVAVWLRAPGVQVGWRMTAYTLQWAGWKP